MKNPPYMKEVLVTTDHECWFTAYFGDYCGELDAWQSTSDDHPECWTEGVCWTLNEHNEPSAPVFEWKDLP